jgi:hypothetical protein
MTDPAGAPELDPSALHGSWHLFRWEIAEGGRTTQPFGDGATGLIVYTPDGHMSACIAAKGRRPLSTGIPRTAPIAERAAAMDGYFHYAGTWRLLPGPRVEHQVTHALNPNFVGTRQTRDVHLQGDRLLLSAAEPLPGGGTRHHRLIWRR